MPKKKTNDVKAEIKKIVKKKKRKVYFGQEVQDAVVEYNTSTNDIERNKIASNFFNKAKQEKKIKTIIGPALESISNFIQKGQKFDLVFIDADKENYKSYYNK